MKCVYDNCLATAEIGLVDYNRIVFITPGQFVDCDDPSTLRLFCQVHFRDYEDRVGLLRLKLDQQMVDAKLASRSDRG